MESEARENILEVVKEGAFVYELGRRRLEAESSALNLK
jgi:hypothetical protein